MVVSTMGDRLRIRQAKPGRLICFHAPEPVSDGLTDRLNNVRPSAGRGRGYGSKKFWPAFQSATHPGDRHQSFRTRATRLLMPYIFLQALARQPPGKSPFIGIKLADSLTEDGAAHGIEELAREETLESAACVKRSDKVEAFAIDRTKQGRYPGRRQAAGRRRNDCARSCRCRSVARKSVRNHFACDQQPDAFLGIDLETAT